MLKGYAALTEALFTVKRKERKNSKAIITCGVVLGRSLHHLVVVLQRQLVGRRRVELGHLLLLDKWDRWLLDGGVVVMAMPGTLGAVRRCEAPVLPLHHRILVLESSLPAHRITATVLLMVAVSVPVVAVGNQVVVAVAVVVVVVAVEHLLPGGAFRERESTGYFKQNTVFDGLIHGFVLQSFQYSG